MNYQELVESGQKEFGLIIKPKSESTLMKVIHVFLLIVSFGQQKNFMTKFTTTIGRTIYLPSSWNEMTDGWQIAILRHELVHLRQQKKYGWFLFAFLYLFFPLPFFLAYYRAKFEKEAYEETLRALKEIYGLQKITDPSIREYILSQFTSGSYLWMWPFRKSLEKWFDEVILRLTSMVDGG